MALEADREAQILQKIKMKMDRIKATQQRVLEENEPKTHAAGKTRTIIVSSHFLKIFSSAFIIFLRELFCDKSEFLIIEVKST